MALRQNEDGTYSDVSERVLTDDEVTGAKSAVEQRVAEINTKVDEQSKTIESTKSQLNEQETELARLGDELTAAKRDGQVFGLYAELDATPAEPEAVPDVASDSAGGSEGSVPETADDSSEVPVSF